MRVNCQANTGKNLKPSYVTLGYTPESQFDLLIGKEYRVLGIMLWMSELLVLLADESKLPNWQPIDLFFVTDDRLDGDWFFSTRVATEHGVQAIWSYEQMIRDTTHYEKLLEREADALRIFYQEEQQKRSQVECNVAAQR